MRSARPRTLLRAVRQRADARGFTLIEVVLVLTLLAVLAAISMPRFQNVRTRWQLEETARLLVADFRRARAEVVRRGGRVEFEFARSAGDYEMTWWPPLEIAIEDWSDEVFEPLDSTVLVRRALPTGVRVDASPRSVRFETDGSCSGARIRVLGAAEELSIALEAASGSATLGESER